MRKIVLSGSMANCLEWYDYALYAHFAGLFSKLFFPSSDPSAALLSTYIVFAVGFLMRPIGAVIFGIIGDRLGRKTSLSLAILLMSITTAIVGLLPTYEQIGIWAPILLSVMRLLQGLSLGGALIGSVSYIIEHSAPNRRGLAGSATMFSLCLGFMIGSLVASLLSGNMNEADFTSYGWRIPFIFGIVTMGMSYYIKNHTAESPEFEKAKKANKLVARPLHEVLKNHKITLAKSIAINALGSVAFYALVVSMLGHLENVRGFSLSQVTAMSTGIMAIIMFSVVVAGWLSDVIGRRLFFILAAIASMVLILPICNIVAYGSLNQIVFALSIFAILAGFWIGPEPALQVEMYPTNIRNTGVSLAYNTGCAVFGGTTPAVIKILYDSYNTIDVAGYYVITVAFLSLIGVVFYKNIVDTTIKS